MADSAQSSSSRTCDGRVVLIMRQYDLNAYYSHPWRTHVSVNLAIWQAMSADCNLIIDRPTIFEGIDPPFYINRIESLFQQTDVFVACLPFQQQPTGELGPQCSPFALFEIRMAERAGLTRFVLYDPRTQFNIQNTSEWTHGMHLVELTNYLPSSVRTLD